LTAGTAYDYYVRAICGPGDSSAFVGPESFSTYGDCASSGTYDYLSNSTLVSSLQSFVANTPGDYITLDFTAGSTEACCDTWYINDAADGSGSTIASGNGPLVGVYESTTGEISFYVVSDGSVNGTTFTYSLSCAPPPACVDPTGLGVSILSSDSVELNWLAGGTETAWNIEYGTAGFALGTGTVMVATTNSDTITGLMANTTYEFYVQADCGGDSSSFAGPFAFTTPCAVVATFPYLQTFDGMTANNGSLTSCVLTDNISDCWSNDISNSNNWIARSVATGSGSTGPSADHTGGGNYAYIETSSCYSNISYMMSSEMDVSSLSSPEMRFWYHMYGGAMGSLSVEVSTDGGGSWSTSLWSLSGDQGDVWSEAIVSLSAYTGSTSLIARFVGTSGTSFTSDIGIDDFIVAEAPSCPEVTGLSAAILNSSSVGLTWSPGSSETEWIIEYGPAGFTPGTGTSIGSTTYPDTITGLSASTPYDFYVQGVCGIGDTSAWSGPVSVVIEYCAAGPSSTSDSNVETVAVTGESTSIAYTGCPGVIGVEDQTAQVADVLTGYNYSTSVQFGTCGGSYAGAGSVWIDWNHNYVFEPSELIGSSAGTPGTAPWDAPVVFNYTVPVTAAVGATTMRVMQQESGTATDPCASFSWGSVIDFTIDVGFGTSCAGVTALTADYVGLDSIAVSWTPGGAESSWNFELGLSGFTPGTGSSVYGSTVATAADSVNGLSMGTDYDIYVQADCGADSSVWVGPFNVTTLLTCPQPTLLGGMILDSDSISVYWTPGDSLETEWLLEYGVSGFTPGTGSQVVVVGAPSDTITGLMGGTIYDIYVQGICAVGDSSFWVGPISLQTPASNDEACDAIELLVNGIEQQFSNIGVTASADEVGLTIPAGASCTASNGWCSFELTITKAMWFRFTAPASGNVRINCSGTAYDGQVALFEGSCDSVPGMSFLYGNDDAPGGGFAPDLTVCGLTPGQEYFIMHDEYAGAGAGTVAFELSDVPTIAGIDGNIEVCESDTVNLMSVISSPADGGVFSYPFNPFAVVDDTLFNASVVPDGLHAVYYVLSNACATDTAVAYVDVQESPSAGTAVDPFDACNDSPTSLWDGLTGSVEFGGSWSDDTGTGLLSGSTFNTVGIPNGTYQFTYTVNNGICPAVSTTVSVIVDDCIGIDEHAMLDLTIYPNPNSGKFFLTNAGITTDLSVRLTDLNGKLVFAKSGTLNANDQMEIDVNVVTGVYMLNVRSNEAVNTYKVVIN
jgi:hypothetical protein